MHATDVPSHQLRRQACLRLVAALHRSCLHARARMHYHLLTLCPGAY